MGLSVQKADGIKTSVQQESLPVVERGKNNTSVFAQFSQPVLTRQEILQDSKIQKLIMRRENAKEKAKDCCPHYYGSYKGITASLGSMITLAAGLGTAALTNNWKKAGLAAMIPALITGVIFTKINNAQKNELNKIEENYNAAINDRIQELKEQYQLNTQA